MSRSDHVRAVEIDRVSWGFPGPPYDSRAPGIAMPPSPPAPFSERVRALPRLGSGISTEFGARHGGVDLEALVRAAPDQVRFLEIGADLERGVDEDARAWAAAGRPTTYHFLDVNLEEDEDLDARWIADTAALAREVGAAWLCGDAGLWHVGPRESRQGLLLPPVLEPESADAMARNVRHLREASGLEVLPENPPAHVFVGRMHLAEYFARMAEAADCGLLLDVAHLAIYQRACGHEPRTGLDAYPFERVVEVHLAGGTEFTSGGRTFVDDDHGVSFLPETWGLFELVLERATNLRAVVLECERNPLDAILPLFDRVASALDGVSAP